MRACPECERWKRECYGCLLVRLLRENGDRLVEAQRADRTNSFRFKDPWRTSAEIETND
jgi:hypothetical protein